MRRQILCEEVKGLKKTTGIGTRSLRIWCGLECNVGLASNSGHKPSRGPSHGESVCKSFECCSLICIVWRLEEPAESISQVRSVRKHSFIYVKASGSVQQMRFLSRRG